MIVNPTRLAPIHNVLQRKTAKILEEDDEGMLVYDPPGHVLMLTHHNPQTAWTWLDRHKEKLAHALLMTCEKPTADYIRTRITLLSHGGCVQAVFTGDPALVHSLLEHQTKVDFIPAAPSDFERIRKHYSLATDGELMYALENGNIFLILEKESGRWAGFCGEHSESSMGFLEIFPEMRRKGYAMLAEAFMTEHMLEKDLIPYCHIFSDNAASLALQKKMGMHVCDNEVEWFWAESDH